LLNFKNRLDSNYQPLDYRGLNRFGEKENRESEEGGKREERGKTEEGEEEGEEKTLVLYSLSCSHCKDQEKEEKGEE
jgi:hypothetical protein